MVLPRPDSCPTAGVRQDDNRRLTEELGNVPISLIEQSRLGRMLFEEVAQETQTAQVSLLGPVAHFIPHYDAPTVGMLV